MPKWELKPGLPKTLGQTTPVKPVCWTTGAKQIKPCEMCPTGDGYYIWLSFPVHQRISALTFKMGNKEWLGYLHGTHDEKKYFLVNGITIPKQIVSTGSVDVLEPEAGAGIIGTVHLHPFDGGLFFSTIDTDYIGSNHQMMIVTNLKNEYKGTVKVNLPCKAYSFIDASVTVLNPTDPAVDHFVGEAVTKIAEAPPIVVVSNESYFDHSFNTPVVENEVLYCGLCRGRVPFDKRRWLNNLVVCEECYKEERPELFNMP